MNFGLLYDLEKAGLNATILFNRIGERIYLVGDLSSGAGSPDIYEAPRSILDFQVAKKIIKKKGDIRLNISDILNQTQNFYPGCPIPPAKYVYFRYVFPIVCANPFIPIVVNFVIWLIV